MHVCLCVWVKRKCCKIHHSISRLWRENNCIPILSSVVDVVPVSHQYISSSTTSTSATTTHTQLIPYVVGGTPKPCTTKWRRSRDVNWGSHNTRFRTRTHKARRPQDFIMDVDHEHRDAVSIPHVTGGLESMIMWSVAPGMCRRNMPRRRSENARRWHHRSRNGPAQYPPQMINAKAWHQWNHGVYLRKDSSCFRCGRYSYRDHRHFCNAIFAKCYKCKKPSHFARVCRSTHVASLHKTRSQHPKFKANSDSVLTVKEAEILPFTSCDDQTFHGNFDLSNCLRIENRSLKSKLQAKQSVLPKTTCDVETNTSFASVHAEDKVMSLQSDLANCRQQLTQMSGTLAIKLDDVKLREDLLRKTLLQKQNDHDNEIETLKSDHSRELISESSEKCKLHREIHSLTNQLSSFRNIEQELDDLKMDYSDLKSKYEHDKRRRYDTEDELEAMKDKCRCYTQSSRSNGSNSNFRSSHPKSDSKCKGNYNNKNRRY